ncbi:hypothetical protein ABIB38_004798 [Massilia sp. UYP11]|uniref:hypothetical protein n=1 Tax=Massilia sp. UYP11 TaxID=1756385 RepID=UPI003D19413A
MEDEYELERMMADFEFPAEEADGDKLEAMKAEGNEVVEFKRWFKSKASPTFKNLNGISRFIDFISNLPSEERSAIREMLEDRILGNPSLEITFMLSYGMPFALSEYWDGMSLMTEELNEINNSVSEEALRNIMLLRSELKTFVSAINKGSQVAIQEIEEAGRRQVVDNELQLKKHEKSLDAFASKVQSDIEAIAKNFEQGIASRKLNIDAEIEAEKTKARNMVYKEISSKVESVADKAFGKVHDKYTLRHAFYNAGAVIVGMAVFTILTKLFS